MKKTFLIILLFTNSFAFFAQEIYEKPVVDERVELMSIVMRLSGAQEYVSNNIPLYANEIDKHFEAYKDHPLIKYTQSLRKFGVSYDAVVDFALYSEIKKGKIVFNKDIKIETLDDRWERDSIPKYLKLLNDFYKKTKFNDFFVKNEQMRKAAEENFAKEITDKVDFDWFKKFFRVLPERKFRIIISLTNGMHNYGPQVIYKDGTEEYYAIMGCWKTDENGFPTYEDKEGTITGTLIHEISHSFCDLPVSKYLDELYPQASVFFQMNQENLYSMACGNPESFLHEVFVRACVSQYNKDHNIKYDIYEHIKKINDFLWVPQLLEAFERYNNDTTYKTLIDFMPEIVKLQNSLDPQKLYEEKPTITGTNIENGSDSVDYNIDHITVYFDKPMLVGYDFPAPYFIPSEPPVIEFTRDKWNNEGTEWTFYVKLEPDTQYRIEIPYWNFIDAKQRYFAKSDYTLTFKTRKEQ